MAGYQPTRDDLSTWAYIQSPKMGSWSFSSKSDSRWNCSGRGEGFVTTGFAGASGAREKLEELGKLYGEEPDDLAYSFWKD